MEQTEIRKPEAIKQDYINACAILGEKQYMKTLLDDDISKLTKHIADLAFENNEALKTPLPAPMGSEVPK